MLCLLKPSCTVIICLSTSSCGSLYVFFKVAMFLEEARSVPLIVSQSGPGLVNHLDGESVQ